jgi:hypothetical protein
MVCVFCDGPESIYWSPPQLVGAEAGDGARELGGYVCKCQECRRIAPFRPVESTLVARLAIHVSSILPGFSAARCPIVRPDNLGHPGLPDVAFSMTTMAERLQEARIKIDAARDAVQGDEGASPVLVAVVNEFATKAGKAAVSPDERVAVIELEQAGDSAKAAAEADSLRHRPHGRQS